MATSATLLKTGYDSFDGDKKCTYIIKVAAGQGAPGFKLTSNTNVYNFDLQYIEFEDHEMDFLAGGSNAAYYGTNLASDTFPDPLADKGKFSGGHRLNWFPQNYYEGQKD